MWVQNICDSYLQCREGFERDSSDYKLVKETPVLYIRDKLIPVVELKEFFNVECEKLDQQIAIIVEKEN
jgi:two-component system chemotaxis sensor kinase CheA